MMELISDIELHNGSNIIIIIDKYNVYRYEVYMIFAKQVANFGNESSAINYIGTSFKKAISVLS